jgi:hypothetical protein
VFQANATSINEYTRVINKDFTVNPDAQLTISNKFGKIHINNWDKNTVSFEIKVIVEASNDNAAAKMLERISVNFNASASLVEANTVIGEMNSQGRTHFQIDYTVNIPVGLNVDLTNKFGDIFLNEITGKAKVNLSYGSLDINKLNNSDNYIDLKFCNSAKIRSIKGAVVNLKYSTLDVDYAGSLRLDSKFSNLNASKVVALNVSFEGGSVDVKNSSVVESRTKFSDLEIDKIEQSLNLDIQYGSCDVREVGPECTSVNVHNRYADVDIRLPESLSYNLDASMRFCELSFNESIANLNYRSITPTSSEYKGIVGGKEGKPKANVVIRSEYGSVNLK